MRVLPTVVICLVGATAAAAPAPAISIYPHISASHGTQTIVLNVVNHTARPIAICSNEIACLALEIKDPRGGWRPWELLPLPVTPRLVSEQDLVEIPAGEGRDVFALAVRPFGAGARDFQIGSAHHLAALPTRAEYRFSYRLDGDAQAAFARLHRSDVAAGPEGSSASPMELLTLEDPDIIDAVKRGDVGVAQYVRAGDTALLRALDPLLDRADFSIASAALYCVIATETPAAADRLFHVLATSHNAQLRSYTAHGFRTIHPRALAPRLLKALATESEEFVITSLVLALGEMDDPGLLGELAAARRGHPTSPIDLEHPAWGIDLSFELAGARLGDRTAEQALGRRIQAVSAHLTERDGTLAELFRELPYTRDPRVAQLLVASFTDNRLGSRNAPYRDGPAPRNARDAQAMADFERHAYVRVADDALFAVLQFFPDEPWGITPTLHAFTPADQQKVRAVVDRRLAAAGP